MHDAPCLAAGHRGCRSTAPPAARMGRKGPEPLQAQICMLDLAPVPCGARNQPTFVGRQACGVRGRRCMGPLTKSSGRVALAEWGGRVRFWQRTCVLADRLSSGRGGEARQSVNETNPVTSQRRPEATLPTPTSPIGTPPPHPHLTRSSHACVTPCRPPKGTQACTASILHPPPMMAGRGGGLLAASTQPPPMCAPPAPALVPPSSPNSSGCSPEAAGKHAMRSA